MRFGTPREDPKIFTKPFTIHFAELLIADSEVIELICAEDEKDARTLPKWIVDRPARTRDVLPRYSASSLERRNPNSGSNHSTQARS